MLDRRSGSSRFSLLVCAVALGTLGFVGCSDDDGSGDVMDPAPKLAGVWRVETMLEECGENEFVTLPVDNQNGITYDLSYEITDTTFQSYYDLIGVPAGLQYQEGLYYCSDWEVSSEAEIDVDTVIVEDGTTINFELDGDQLIVQMQYDHEPNCTDTYNCREVADPDLASATEDCDLLDTEF